MERYNVNAVAAFNLLVKISQERNTPVDEIARKLVVEERHPGGVARAWKRAGRCCLTPGAAP